MDIIGVPYHLDEHLPDLDFPLPPGQEVTASLPAAGTWERLAVLYAAVSRAAEDAAGRGSVPVVISGDCTTSLGIVAGLQRTGADLGIVWFDAHGDVQTLETTASGYLGGLPLRLLTGYRPELIATALGLRPVAEHQVVLAGTRDLDPPEASYLATAQIRCRDVTSLQPADLPDGPLYVHLDLDVVDPSEMPGLIFPTPGGPSLAQVGSALQHVIGTGRVAAVGIACTWHSSQPAAPGLGPWLQSALTGAG
ncbi:MAG: arginase family protein [Actinomycetota bacterium]